MNPLVTVLLCTRNRAELAAQAIRCFQQQDYPKLELVVVEDGAHNVSELVKNIPHAVYARKECKNLAQKRNVGIQHASGSIIVNFDDDDWQAPSRVGHQVNAIRASPEMNVVGYHTAYFWDFAKKQASCYHGMLDYSWGACLCYRKSYAVEHPWPEHIDVAEDNVFIQPARSAGKLLALDGRGHIVLRLQEGKAVNTSNWPNVPASELPAQFFAESDLCNAAS